MSADTPAGSMAAAFRAAVLKGYREIAKDPEIAVAAFGISCRDIQLSLNVPLRVAARLLEAWLVEEEAQAKAHAHAGNSHSAVPTGTSASTSPPGTGPPSEP